MGKVADEFVCSKTVLEMNALHAVSESIASPDESVASLSCDRPRQPGSAPTLAREASASPRGRRTLSPPNHKQRHHGPGLEATPRSRGLRLGKKKKAGKISHSKPVSPENGNCRHGLKNKVPGGEGERERRREGKGEVPLSASLPLEDPAPMQGLRVALGGQPPGGTATLQTRVRTGSGVGWVSLAAGTPTGTDIP